jgi:hypothetical protein
MDWDGRGFLNLQAPSERGGETSFHGKRCIKTEGINWNSEHMCCPEGWGKGSHRQIIEDVAKKLPYVVNWNTQWWPTYGRPLENKRENSKEPGGEEAEAIKSFLRIHLNMEYARDHPNQGLRIGVKNCLSQISKDGERNLANSWSTIISELGCTNFPES